METQYVGQERVECKVAWVNRGENKREKVKLGINKRKTKHASTKMTKAIPKITNEVKMVKRKACIKQQQKVMSETK